MRVALKQRCCPKCKSIDFESADCEEGREKLNGFTMQCLDCDWQGFKMQLVVQEGVLTAAEAAKQINEEHAQREANG
jgi:hypothetical protein